METLFISDLHLGASRPDKLELFRQLLRGPARQAKALYILGDLFDQFWLGNDDNTAVTTMIITELRRFASSGIPVFFIRGNRELVIDQAFSSSSGCTLLSDQAVIDLEGRQTLIMHGDLLCSDDDNYQAFRRLVENPVIKRLFTLLPFKLRTLITQGLKPVFYKSKLQKSAAIMDVNQATVVRCMQDHGVTELIHGHTHRPGMHLFKLNGRGARRTVLGDWYDKCEILVCNGCEWELIPVQQYMQKHK